MPIYNVSTAEEVYYVSVTEDRYCLSTQEEVLHVQVVDYVYNVSVTVTGDVYQYDGTAIGGGDGVPEYFSIDGGNVSAGYIRLIGSGGNWNTNKAIIKQVNVYTDCTDWDLSLLTDSGGGVFPDYPIMEQGYGDEHIFLDLPYEDESATDSVWFQLVDNVGGQTFNIDVFGMELA